MRGYLGILIGLSLLLPAPARAGGEIYGSIFTSDGETYTGPIRWDQNEAFWNDLMDATKVEQAPGVQEGEGLDPRLFDLELGRSGGGREATKTHNAFSVPFGQVRAVEPEPNGRVLLELKNGLRTEVIGSGDLGASMRGVDVWDEGRGLVHISWEEVERAEFHPSATESRDGERLFGTVNTAAGDFTGYIVLGGRDCLGSDTFLEDPSHIPMAEIVSIERLENGHAQVVRRGGVVTDIDLTAEGKAPPVVEIAVGKLGWVAAGWPQFQKVVFSPPPPSPPYGNFDGGRRLYGTVTTSAGVRHTGEIVWDNDESHSWESLDGESRGVDFMIQFENIVRIERRSADASLVRLRDGMDLELRGSSDVGRSNRGIRLRTAGGGEIEVSWAEFTSVEFSRS